MARRAFFFRVSTLRRLRLLMAIYHRKMLRPRLFGAARLRLL
jgi:hypothetical protein